MHYREITLSDGATWRASTLRTSQVMSTSGAAPERTCEPCRTFVLFVGPNQERRVWRPVLTLDRLSNQELLEGLQAATTRYHAETWIEEEFALLRRQLALKHT
jgi:hypothetical protein